MDVKRKAFLAIFFIGPNLFVWKGHSVLTRLVIEKNHINLPHIEVVPLYEKGKIKDEEDCRELMEDKPLKVLDFITLHVVEPDCGMDEKGEDSFIVRFIGGPQGYRHMYYPFGRWKFPLLFLPMGKAPERAEHFFNKAKEEFKRGNPSLGWLYLSWSLHYIEDLSMPYHTCQTSLKFVMWKNPIEGTTSVTKNFHYAFEDFVYYLVTGEENGRLSLSLIDALSEPRMLPFNDVKSLAKGVAKESSKLCDEIFDLSFEMWGEKLKVNKMVRLSDEDMKNSLSHPSFKKHLNSLKEALRLFSGSVIRFFSLSQNLVREE